MESEEERIRRVVAESVEIVPWDPGWSQAFLEEASRLRARLPADLIGQIEHFGSTAVPGLPAKPIVDVLVEVSSLADAGERAVPILTAHGYEAFWRPTWGDDGLPFYWWFIRRNAEGARTHHLHFVEPDFEHWDRLFFADWLREHAEDAEAYGRLKLRLALKHPGDRVAYTAGKTEFVGAVMDRIAALTHAYEGPEPERVRRAARWLAQGSLSALRHYLAVARIDYRDVLFWAEYPDEVETTRRDLGAEEEEEAGGQ